MEWSNFDRLFTFSRKYEILLDHNSAGASECFSAPTFATAIDSETCDALSRHERELDGETEVESKKGIVSNSSILYDGRPPMTLPEVEFIEGNAAEQHRATLVHSSILRGLRSVAELVITIYNSDGVQARTFDIGSLDSRTASALICSNLLSDSTLTSSLYTADFRLVKVRADGSKSTTEECTVHASKAIHLERGRNEEEQDRKMMHEYGVGKVFQAIIFLYSGKYVIRVIVPSEMTSEEAGEYVCTRSLQRPDAVCITEVATEINIVRGRQALKHHREHCVSLGENSLEAVSFSLDFDGKFVNVAGDTAAVGGEMLVDEKLFEMFNSIVRVKAGVGAKEKGAEICRNLSQEKWQIAGNSCIAKVATAINVQRGKMRMYSKAWRDQHQEQGLGMQQGIELRSVLIGNVFVPVPSVSISEGTSSREAAEHLCSTTKNTSAMKSKTECLQTTMAEINIERSWAEESKRRKPELSRVRAELLHLSRKLEAMRRSNPHLQLQDLDLSFALQLSQGFISTTAAEVATVTKTRSARDVLFDRSAELLEKATLDHAGDAETDGVVVPYLKSIRACMQSLVVAFRLLVKIPTAYLADKILDVSGTMKVQNLGTFLDFLVLSHSEEGFLLLFQKNLVHF